jgi:hypothetical protein
MASRIEREKVKRQIAQIMDKIQTEADPLLLNQYRSLIKKEVSFFRRSYVAAYLLMLSDQNGTGRFASGRGGRANGPSGKSNGDQNSRSNRSRKSSGADSAEGQRPDRSEPREPKVYPLAEEESVRLFVSVGRSRRVFPREILGLINAKTTISRDDIGAIRILDNYSFVQVRTTVADTIIEALNGQTFRGRPLSVNYARSRNGQKPTIRTPPAVRISRTPVPRTRTASGNRTRVLIKTPLKMTPTRTWARIRLGMMNPPERMIRTSFPAAGTQLKRKMIIPMKKAFKPIPRISRSQAIISKVYAFTV